jgi:hypothetical protein
MPVMERTGIKLPTEVLNRSEPFSGNRVRVASDNAVVSKGGVIYYPFSSEKEVSEWIDNVVPEWWDDETV